MRHSPTLFLLVALGLPVFIPAANAQQPAQPSPQPSAPAAPPPLPIVRPDAQPAPAAGSLQVPDGNKQRILIRMMLVALNHANLTGNYSVLRDLGSPGFREANNPARLAEIFANMRLRNLDLGPIVVVEPLLTRKPSIDENGMLRLTGLFPTRPEQVNFDLAFQFVAGQWRLFGIAVNTTQAPPPEAKSKPGQ
jgi:hypothetical protein